MTLLFGQEIRWRNNGGGHSSVFTGYHPSRRAATVSALRGARLCCWTPPRWYQWWRWGDRDYRRNLLPIRERRANPTYREGREG